MKCEIFSGKSIIRTFGGVEIPQLNKYDLINFCRNFCPKGGYLDFYDDDGNDAFTMGYSIYGNVFLEPKNEKYNYLTLWG